MFSLKKKKGKHEVMVTDVLINSLGWGWEESMYTFISLYILNHHIVHFKYRTILLVNCIPIKPGEKVYWCKSGKESVNGITESNRSEECGRVQYR